MVLWLNGILIAMVEIEKIPEELKCGVMIPIYKSAGKNALNMNNYRGVALTLMIVKVGESAFLQYIEQPGSEHTSGSELLDLPLWLNKG